MALALSSPIKLVGPSRLLDQMAPSLTRVLVLSHASSDSYKYQYRSDRIFLPYAHLLYIVCYPREIHHGPYKLRPPQ